MQGIFGIELNGYSRMLSVVDYMFYVPFIIGSLTNILHTLCQPSRECRLHEDMLVNIRHPQEAVDEVLAHSGGRP